MTHAAPAPRLGREFDPFLFASIGDDRHEQPLSVLSALARSGLDPWQEAASLSQLSGAAATARLAALIAALPDEPLAKLPVYPVAGDLVALLPRVKSFASPAPRELPTASDSENVRAALGLGALVLMTALALLISAPQSPRPEQSAGSFTSTATAAMSPLPPFLRD